MLGIAAIAATAAITTIRCINRVSLRLAEA
jgi:hypothetical protein